MKTLRWIFFFALLILILVFWGYDFIATTAWGGWLSGLAVGIILVMLVDLIHRALLARRFRRLQVPTDSSTDVRLRETVTYEAGHRRRRGLLFLTDTHLFFQRRPLHNDEIDLAIPLENIAVMQPFNRLGALPTGLEIGTTDGKVYRFRTERRGAWIAALERQRPDLRVKQA